jgi:hypothetical protein
MQELPLYINEKCKPFIEIVQNRLRGNFENVNQEKMGNPALLETVQVDNYSIEIEFYKYGYQYPKRAFYRIFEDVPTWKGVFNDFWLCPSPGKGFFKITPQK